MARGNSVFATIQPRLMSAPVGGPPVANDIFLHALFVRCTLTNNQTIEFQTRFDRDTQTVELIIPENMQTLLEQITGLQRGPNMIKFVDWLIGSKTLKPNLIHDPDFVPSSAISIWFGATQSTIDDKLVITLPDTDASVIGYNLKTNDQLLGKTSGSLGVYLVWTFICGGNTSFNLRTTVQINDEVGSAPVLLSEDVEISTVNLIPGDIRETLLMTFDAYSNNIDNFLIYRNYSGSLDPKTEGIGVLGIRFRLL